jgi:hypothetical protein
LVIICIIFREIDQIEIGWIFPQKSKKKSSGFGLKSSGKSATDKEI